MSDGVYETVPVVPSWSSGANYHHTSSKALPVPSKAAVDAYTSAHPAEHRGSAQRPSLQDDGMVTRPPLPPPRQRSSNSESEISCSPKHSSSMLNRVKSVKGGGIVPDRISPGGAPIRKSPSATSVESTELSLTAFVDKHSSSFPLRVTVTKGFYGVSDQTAITTGDSYNFHFLKRTTVVVATDPKGCEYSVPLDSSLRLALLYETTGNLEDAKKGTGFDTCADLPVLQGPSSGRGRFPPFQRREHGVVGGSQRGLSNRKKQLKFHSVTHNMPKVLSETCSCAFTTSPRVTGAALSALQLQKEWLPIKVLVCPREVEEVEDGTGILAELSNLVLTLTSLREEVTIVATGAAGDPSEVLEVIELPKSLDIEVELLPLAKGDLAGLIDNTQNRFDGFSPTSVIYYTNKPTPKLYDIQCALYKTMVREEFQSMLVKPSFMGQRRGSMADSTKTDVDDLLPPIYMYGAHATSSSPRDTYVKPDVSSSLRDQRLNSVSEETSSRRPDTLLSSEAPGKTTEVHHLEAYASVYERRTNLNTTEVPKKAESQPLEPPAMRVSDHLQEYVTMTPTSDPGTLEGGAFANLQQRISRLEESRKEYERNIEQEISKISAQLTIQSGKLASMLESSQGVKGECLRLKEEVDRLKAAVENPYSVSYHPGPRLNGKVNGHVAYSTSPPTSSSESPFPPDPKADERNKEYLLSMDVEKVLRLLECMSLAQYQEAFQKEQINGELLSDCDETMLQNDLGIASKLHRMRLIKVITGRHSAKSILDGGDPYAGRFVSRS
ncbi:hypothetical protein EMCRGX_G007873 [Ephydatia muelleri]